MGNAFDFSIPAKILYTTSRMATAQSIGLSMDKAPNMMFPTVIVIWVGFSRYSIGIKNSRTYLSLTSLYSETTYPSFGLTWVENFPSIN